MCMQIITTDPHLCHVRSHQLSLNDAIVFKENDDQTQNRGRDGRSEVHALSISHNTIPWYDFCRIMALAQSVAFGVKAKITNIGRSFWIVYMECVLSTVCTRNRMTVDY